MEFFTLKWVKNTIIVHLMSMQRRRFLKYFALSSLATFGTLRQQHANATPTEPLVSELELEAKAIHYVHDSQQVNLDEFDFHIQGSHCANCRFYQAKLDGQFGHCKMYFPNRLVKSTGWCVGWMKKA